MWTLDFTWEVKGYFIDNYPYTFPLLIEIENLKFVESGLPDGYQPMGEEWYWWEVLGHAVVYQRLAATKTLYIAAVKPL